MNKWQMEGRTITWPHGGGVGTDDKGNRHASIRSRRIDNGPRPR